jgi:hypothetical protein
MPKAARRASGVGTTECNTLKRIDGSNGVGFASAISPVGLVGRTTKEAGEGIA